MQFDFGKNWIRFSKKALTPEKVESARTDFHNLFKDIDLKEKQFLDIGFGQGLSLLFAREDGANVIGNDINPKCKEALDITASILKTDSDVKVVLGSILDKTTVSTLIEQTPSKSGFDIVHSWGVLHHTGDMKTAIRNAASLVKRNGYLVIAIYNHHITSLPWRFIKWFYCKSPQFIKTLLIYSFFPVIAAAKFAVTGKNPFVNSRGMDFLINVIDWIGGYPYEYASREEIIDLLDLLGFSCVYFRKSEVPTGCNEFVFKHEILE